jgi:hypothetical protein
MKMKLQTPETHTSPRIQDAQTARGLRPLSLSMADNTLPLPVSFPPPANLVMDKTQRPAGLTAALVVSGPFGVRFARARSKLRSAGERRFLKSERRRFDIRDLESGLI